MASRDWRRGFSPRTGRAHGAADIGSRDNQFSWRRELPAQRSAARLLEKSGEEILGVYALPEAHRKRMRTTNMAERQNRELKRRTRIVRVFPHEQSLLV
jgi:transposase-like protein